ncbi:thymidine phosphorylase [Xanthomonas sp. Leaf131]|nr:thymidine phosphorylase [Xanthomonas sp. Leaf131]
MSTPASSLQHTLSGPIADAPVSARGRRLLAALHAQCVQALSGPLRLTIVELERELLHQAEHARNSQIQAETYAQTRGLRDHIDRFPHAFLQQLAQDLANLRERPSLTPLADTVAHPQMLTLVEDTDIDRDIVLSEIARRETSRRADALQLLAQRLAVIGAVAEFELEEVPLGPYALCRVLRECGEALGLSLDGQLTLYRVFERQLIERLNDLFERANSLLAQEGILPGLIYHPYLVKPTQVQTRRAPSASATASKDAAANKHAAPQRNGRPATGWSGQSAPTPWQSALLDPSDVPMALAAATYGEQATPALSDAVQALGGLMSSARQSQAAGNAGPAAQHSSSNHGAANHGTADATGAQAPPERAAPQLASSAVPKAALSDALASLQGALATQAAASTQSSGIDAVQRQVLDLLRAQHGPDAALSPQDTDTFDLLGLLYAQMQREVREQTPAQALLAKLQVPVVRAALADAHFFVRDQHPVRELLNTVAESGAVWLGEDDVDPQLLHKLGNAVDKIVNDYHGDESVFAAANDEIQTHLRALARKAEVAERRHVDAARGKERLESAKQQAAARIEQLCEQSAPPRFVQSLLRQAWSDVLTLTLLRQGEQSPEWDERQALTARIAEVTCRSKDQPTDTALGTDVETALLQVGYHQDEAAAIARRLSTPGGEDELTSRTELTAKLKARTRLGDQGDNTPRKEAATPRSPAEEACYTQLRSLPFGTWFEFVVNQQGDLRRQRLSWYSPMTDHALFVNQRGQKVGEQSLDGLSRLMAGGQVRLLVEEKSRLIDRAWHATVRTLRSLAGQSPTAEVQP